MNTRLLKKIADIDIDNLTLNKLCELLKINLDDINANIDDVAANFFNEDNKAFVSTLNSIYRICLIYFKGDIDKAKQQCIDTCTLKYLFQYQRINADIQLQFFNELIASFDNRYKIVDPQSSLVNQLRSYIILGDDISLESVEGIINNIDINAESIDAIQEAYNAADGRVKDIINGSIDLVLNNRNLPLDTLFAVLSQNLNLDETVIEDLNFDEEDNESEDEILETNNEQNVEADQEPVRNVDPAQNSSMEETPIEQEIPDIATELFQNNNEVHIINNKYRIDNIQFSYLLSAYTENQLKDALERLIPELFPDDMLNNISSAIFKLIFKKTNSELTQAQLQKQFNNFKKKGHKILGTFIKAKNASIILPISIIKLYLQLLDPELASKVTFTKDSTFATTFTHYTVNSEHANLYTAPMEVRIDNFIANNDLVALYNKVNNIELKEQSSQEDVSIDQSIKDTSIEDTPLQNSQSTDIPSINNQSIDNQFTEQINLSEESISNQSSVEDTIEQISQQDSSGKNKHSTRKTKKKVEDISDRNITYLFDIINNQQKVNQAIINYVTSLFTPNNMDKHIYSTITNVINTMVTYSTIIPPERIERYVQRIDDERSLTMAFNDILSYTSYPNKLSSKQFKQLLIDIDPSLIKTYKYKADSILIKTCFEYIMKHIDICVNAVAQIWSKYFTHDRFGNAYNIVLSEHSEELEVLNQQRMQNSTSEEDNKSTKQDEQEVVEKLVQSTQPEELKTEEPKQEESTSIKTDSSGNINFDTNTVKDFIKAIASHYSITSNQVMIEIINRTMLVIDNLDIINAKNVRTPLNILLNFQNNTALGNAVLDAIIKYFSSKDFNISKPAINSIFAKSLFEFIQVNKTYANFIRNKVNTLFKSVSNRPSQQNTQQNTSSSQSNQLNQPNQINQFNQSNETNEIAKQQRVPPLVSNRDLSWQEIRQLPTVDRANEVNDSIKDDVNFNIANFFNNEKLIVLRDDVLTAPSGMSYQNMLNDYIKENPNISIDAYATGILSNNCAFITSYGKLDKLEVIKTIKQYCSVSKIYFKQGNRNLMLIMERIARRKK